MVRSKLPKNKKYQPGVLQKGSKSAAIFTPRVFTPRELRSIELMAKLGATDIQMAQFFKVHARTITDWKRKHVAFRESLKRGKIEADMKVAQALYKRAVGYSYIEEEYSAIEVNGVPVPIDEMVKVKRVKKVMPPDTKAAIKWLQTRHREFWTLPEITHRHTGSINHLHRKLQDIPVNELSGDAQKLVFEIAQKQLSVIAQDAEVVDDKPNYEED